MNAGKKLILGGAQIGQDYGVVRKTSFSGSGGIQKLLDTAKSVGFAAIDTARTYGRSENLLGEHFWDGQFHTKLDERTDPSRSLCNSLEALKIDSVDLLYVCHDASRVSDTSRDYWAPHLMELGARAREIGVAIYSDQLDFPLLEFAEIQTIQVPLNILTSSVTRQRVSDLRRMGKRINARSIFAQGLLLNDPHERVEPGVARSIQAFQEVARSLDLDSAELAFRWALTYPEIDGVIMGVGQLEELDYVKRWCDIGPLAKEEFAYVEAALGGFRQDIDLRKI
ncbi:aldo/keto reductase [Pontimonas sp.]|nr:aldo/keto reductase [Pontimonas sp.]